MLSIPARMEDLGVDHKLLFDKNFLVLLVNQRLVPTLCESCKVPITDDAQVSGLFEGRTLEGDSAEEDWRLRLERYRSIAGDGTHLRGKGCDACNGSGIEGRLLVAELVMMDDLSRDAVRARIGRRGKAAWKQPGGLPSKASRWPTSAMGNWTLWMSRSWFAVWKRRVTATRRVG